ncbi:MAG: hypothetical protein AB7O97_02030 [Planctomycetota bacterium]
MKTNLMLAIASALAFLAPSTSAIAEAPTAPRLPFVLPVPGTGTIAVQALTRRGQNMCFGEVRLFQGGVCVRGPKLTDLAGRVWFNNLNAGHYEVRVRNYVTGRTGSTVQYLHNGQATWVNVAVD